MELLPVDPSCPACSEGLINRADDIFDGVESRCRSCGTHVVAVEYPDKLVWALRFEPCEKCGGGNNSTFGEEHKEGCPDDPERGFLESEASGSGG